VHELFSSIFESIEEGRLTPVVTLIIPTFNRPQFVARVLRYYADQNFPHQIIVADGSYAEGKKANERTVSAMKDKLNVHHHCYDPEISLFSRVALVCERSKTKYALMCSDDDFIVPSTIDKGVDFLESHPDYALVYGRAAILDIGQASDRHIHEHITSHTYRQFTIDIDDPGQRLINHLADYTPTYYAMHRRGELADTMRVTGENTKDFRFGEMLTTSLSIIHGKVKCLDALYMVRQVNMDSTSLNTIGWDDLLASQDYSERYIAFRDSVAEKLAKVAGLNPENAKETANHAFTAYLGRVLPQMIKKHSDEWGIVPIHDNSAWPPTMTSIARILEVMKYELRERHLRDVFRAPLYTYDRLKHELIRRKELTDDPMRLENIMKPASPYHEDFSPILDSASRFPEGIEAAATLPRVEE